MATDPKSILTPEQVAETDRHRRQMLSDDDWCSDCGESHPCPCDDAEDGWFDDPSDWLEEA